MYNRGDACGQFGTYTVTTGTGEAAFGQFKNDRHTTLEARAYNFKLIWSKPISVQLYRLNDYTTTEFPTGKNGNSLGSFTYYPKAQDNAIYALVMEMYNSVNAANYKNKLNDTDLYAYSFASSAGSFSKFLTDINWDSEAQGWKFMQHDDTSITVSDTNTTLRIYYSRGAYLTIVNNNKKGYTLTVDSLTVLGRDSAATGYGYVTAVNYITQDTLLPLKDTDSLLNDNGKLELKDGESVKLLFPGAVGKVWTLNGVFTSASGQPVSGAKISCTLDRTATDGGKKEVLETDEDGSIKQLNGNTNGNAGGNYEILFGDPINICKVGNTPFPTLNDAWDYINNGLKADFKYMKDGEEAEKKDYLGGKIEMLVDYLQPLSDVLNIPKGYYLELTTAQAGDGELDYHGGIDAQGKPIERATISRDTDNAGAAIIAEADKNQAVMADACTSFIVLDNITFDGKALAKKGNGGAISTVNNVVTIKNCDFKGYHAQRGGAVFVVWGSLTVDGCSFSNCTTGDSADKTGGGAIWSTSKVLTVRNSTFDHCACVQVTGGKSQAGALFHNIQQGGNYVYSGASAFSKYPSDYYKGTKTVVEDCQFKDCYAEQGSGGTMESDALEIYLKECTFKGSYSNKDNANGGALNIFHNNANYNAQGVYTSFSESLLEVIGCKFEDCETKKSGSRGGAVQASNTETVRIWGCTFKNCSSDEGGAVRMGANDSTLDIQASTFTDCTGRTSSGAVYTPAKIVTIGNESSHTYGSGEVSPWDETVTWTVKNSRFENCTSPQYGGVYQNRSSSDSAATVSHTDFENCSSTNSEAGALFTTALAMSISDSTFTKCSATGNGGAVSHGSTSDTLNNVTFSECTSGVSGGGAYLTSGTIDITGGSFNDCTAQSSGGGLYSKNTLTIDSCDFEGDKVLDTSGTGGAIHFDGGELIFKNESDQAKGVIKGCKANRGGGIYQVETDFVPNLFNKSTCIQGYYLDGSGNPKPDAPSEYSELIPVEAGKTYTISGICTTEKDGNKRFHAYNSAGKWLRQQAYYSAKAGKPYSSTFTIPNDVAYIRISVRIADTEVQMRQADSVLPYVPYGVTTGTTAVLTGGKIEECEAANGAGYYKDGGDLTVNNASILNCTASEDGGGIYSEDGAVNIYATDESGKIDGCTAKNGGGIYLVQNTLNLGESGQSSKGIISNCQAAQNGGGIYLQNTGVAYLRNTSSITGCKAEQSGGGVYQSGGRVDICDSSTISGCISSSSGGGIYVAGGALGFYGNASKIENCNAGNGGGIYNASGSVEIGNSASDASFGGSIVKCNARHQGGGIYQAAGNGLTIAGGIIGGSSDNANTAEYGAGLFVANNASVSIDNSGKANLNPQITHNHARVGGGGIAVGGDNAKITFTNKSTVQYNTMGEEETECNVYLDRNRNDVINNGALSGDAYIGVYVKDDWENLHGLPGMPFATRSSTNNLNRYFNDRYPYSGGQGANSLVIWQPFVCKLTDGYNLLHPEEDVDSHILYTDAACKNPAAFIQLDNNGASGTDSAFGFVESGNQLYKKNAATGQGEAYSGDYFIEMLVDGYTCETRIGLSTGKTVTLTTASKEPDECNFYYNGEAEFATVKRGGTWGDAWITNSGNLTFANIIMDADGKRSTETNHGGIVAVMDDGVVTVKENATLKNGATSADGGGAIALYNNGSVLNLEGGVIESCSAEGKSGGAVYIIQDGTFNMSRGTIRNCSAANGGAVYVQAGGRFDMSGGEITGCSATSQGGAITVGGTNALLKFSGLVKVIDNTATKNGSSVPDNVELNQNTNDVIQAGHLSSQSEIGVYATDGDPYNKHGKQDLTFGTWEDNDIPNLYPFVNDRHNNLHGLRNGSNAEDELIYWKPSPALKVSKVMESDLAADADKAFNFTVTLSDKSFSGYYGEMQFVNGVAKFSLQPGEENAKMATGLPESFVADGVTYTIGDRTVTLAITDSGRDGSVYLTEL